MRDCDILPDFTVICNNPLNYEHVYHGTSSLLINEELVTLFKTDFETNNTEIRVIYLGKIKLLLNGAEIYKSEDDCGWTIDYYRHTGKVTRIEIESICGSYLGGIHFIEDFPEYNGIEILRKKAVWNQNSLKCEDIIVNIDIEIKEIPEFIRHFDVFYEGFFTRVYDKHFRIEDIDSKGNDINLVVKAENLAGDYIASLDILIPYSEILLTNPM